MRVKAQDNRIAQINTNIEIIRKTTGKGRLDRMIDLFAFVRRTVSCELTSGVVRLRIRPGGAEGGAG